MASTFVDVLDETGLFNVFDVDGSFFGNYIALHDKYGEIIYWEASEWEQDFNTQVFIGYLIRLGNAEGGLAVRKETGIIPTAYDLDFMLGEDDLTSEEFERAMIYFGYEKQL